MAETQPGKPGAPTAPDGPTGRLARWLAALDPAQVPARVRERAKLVILDGIACALVGAHLPWSEVAAQAVLGLEGEGEASLIGWSRKTSAPAAALLNGTFIQGFELDDYHPTAPIHSASIVVPTLLALAQHRGRIDGGRFLLGAVAGFEVGPRVGLALHGAEVLKRGWHSGSIFGVPASAAAAGILLGLEAGAFEDALGLAATQACGLSGARYEAMCKRMHHGFAARNGLYSAVLAAGGYTGVKRVFDGEPGGYLAAFGEGHDPDQSQIAYALGERWETERIAIKPYAACGALHAGIDAVLEIARRRKLVAAEIARIDIAMAETCFRYNGWTAKRPLTPIGGQMNMAYCAALAIVDGQVMAEQFNPAHLERKEIWDLIARTEVRHETSFDGRPDLWQAIAVRIDFTDGGREAATVTSPKGAASPLAAAEIIEKYRRLTGPLIAPDRQAAIERMVLQLEALDDVGNLVALLAPEARPALA